MKSEQTDDLVRAHDAWLAVVRAYNECSLTLTQQLEPLGLSLLEHEILMNLRSVPGLTQQALSERCFSAKSGISMIVARLEKQGILSRQPSPTDGRARCLFLTDMGAALAKRAAAVQTRIVGHMAQVYAPDELTALQHKMDESSEHLRQIRQDLAQTKTPAAMGNGG